MIVEKEDKNQQDPIRGEQVLVGIKEVKEQVIKVLEEGNLLKVDLKKIRLEEGKEASSSFFLQENLLDKKVQNKPYPQNPYYYIFPKKVILYE